MTIILCLNSLKTETVFYSAFCPLLTDVVIHKMFNKYYAITSNWLTKWVTGMVVPIGMQTGRQ